LFSPEFTTLLNEALTSTGSTEHNSFALPRQYIASYRMSDLPLVAYIITA
jgi:hypothetical protein